MIDLNRKISAPIAVSLVLLTQTASADLTKTHLGNISYTGSACPKGSVSTSLSSNKKRVTVHFNNYIVTLRGRNQSSSRKKVCTLAIPVKVPKGWSVSLVSANYYGRLELSNGADARIMNEYSFAGTRGGRFRTVFRGPTTRKYSLKDPLTRLAGVWSSCGTNATIRITTSARVKSHGNQSKSEADIRNGLVTRLQYRRCQ